MDPLNRLNGPQLSTSTLLHLTSSASHACFHAATCACSAMSTSCAAAEPACMKMRGRSTDSALQTWKFDNASRKTPACGTTPAG
eukprot:scaffold5066_cov18-Tisochrysis_lutea.AAC.3